MEAGADKAESQFAEGKHTFLKKFDQNLPLLFVASFCPLSTNHCPLKNNRLLSQTVVFL